MPIEASRGKAANMKKNRHEAILSLISRYDIGTQEELMQKLNEQGYKVTQATVSRDIKF